MQIHTTRDREALASASAAFGAMPVGRLFFTSLRSRRVETNDSIREHANKQRALPPRFRWVCDWLAAAPGHASTRESPRPVLHASGHPHQESWVRHIAASHSSLQSPDARAATDFGALGADGPKLGHRPHLPAQIRGLPACVLGSLAPAARRPALRSAPERFPVIARPWGTCERKRHARVIQGLASRRLHWTSIRPGLAENEQSERRSPANSVFRCKKRRLRLRSLPRLDALGGNDRNREREVAPRSSPEGLWLECPRSAADTIN